MHTVLRSSRPIGIITGSGPEAGINLWQKVLTATRHYFDEQFRGDLDAPQLALRSVPTLGLSMELGNYKAQVWQSLLDTATRIALDAKAYTVACNTLNIFTEELRQSTPQSQVISYPECALAFLKKNNITHAGLLAAAPVLKLDNLSSFRFLNDVLPLEVPRDHLACQQTIYALKKSGPTNPHLLTQVYRLIDDMEAEHVLLACTEFSMLDLSGYSGAKNVTDVSQLVAEELVRFAFATEP